eukprot:Amastigsp_a511359_54.p4 type:complete len:141 gc:universal Amastigsp_a511359_54:944-522(-)
MGFTDVKASISRVLESTSGASSQKRAQSPETHDCSTRSRTLSRCERLRLCCTWPISLSIQGHEPWSRGLDPGGPAAMHVEPPSAALPSDAAQLMQRSRACSHGRRSAASCRLCLPPRCSVRCSAVSPGVDGWPQNGGPRV